MTAAVKISLLSHFWGFEVLWIAWVLIYRLIIIHKTILEAKKLNTSGEFGWISEFRYFFWQNVWLYLKKFRCKKKHHSFSSLSKPKSNWQKFHNIIMETLSAQIVHTTIFELLVFFFTKNRIFYTKLEFWRKSEIFRTLLIS